MSEESRMTRTIRWVSIGIGGLLLLGVVAVLLLPSLVNLERYRTLLAQRVGRSLGREVTLGALRVSLWGGVGAEATSIYDSRNSIFAAYRTLFCQWNLVFAIGVANRRLGCTPTRLSLVWQKWREYSRHKPFPLSAGY